MLITELSPARCYEWAVKHRTQSRLIRGEVAIDRVSFFTEASAALQFPPYFGWNWDAFQECFHEAEWAGGERGTIIVVNALQALNDRQSRDTLLRITDAVHGGRPPTSPIVVLQGPGADVRHAWSLEDSIGFWQPNEI